jgi:hypothetical protein
MRRNIIAALALLLWGAGLTASAVAQQPVKLGVLNDQTGLYADLSGMGSVHAARMAVEDFGGARTTPLTSTPAPPRRISPEKPVRRTACTGASTPTALRRRSARRW